MIQVFIFVGADDYFISAPGDFRLLKGNNIILIIPIVYYTMNIVILSDLCQIEERKKLMGE